MPKSRDQQGRFISSSKNSWKANSAGQSQEGKELNQPNYLSPTTSSLAKKNPEASPQESKTVQGSLHTEVQLSEEQINEQYHSREFLFPEAPLETKDNPQKEMAHDIVKEEPTTFGFPIKETDEETKMKNIPHSTLPNFHGLSKEDLDTFLFEFDVLCRSYDYVTDAQKLNLFPATLKSIALRWFMGLGKDTSTHGIKWQRNF
jgi:hypothetical protein